MRHSTSRAQALVALLAIGALAVVIGGCGGGVGDSSSSEASGATGDATSGATSSTPVLSKDDLISQACDITVETANDAATIPVPKDASDLEQLGVYIPKLAKAQQSGIDQLAALTPPNDLKADWSQLITLLQDNQKQLDLIQEKVAEKDREGVKKLGNINPNQDAITKIVSTIGLDQCASK